MKYVIEVTDFSKGKIDPYGCVYYDTKYVNSLGKLAAFASAKIFDNFKKALEEAATIKYAKVRELEYATVHNSKDNVEDILDFAKCASEYFI